MNTEASQTLGTEIGAEIDPGTRLGHVHLKVANLERSLAFYHGVLGFAVTLRVGDSAAFISAGGYHHHIGLNTWESLGGRRRRRGRPACTISPSATPLVRRWPMPCAAFSPQALRWTARVTTGSARLCTCMTRMRLVSSFTGTVPARHGPEQQTAA